MTQLALPLGIRQLPRRPEWRTQCCGVLTSGQCSDCPLTAPMRPTDPRLLSRASGPETSKRVAKKVSTFEASHRAKIFAVICDAEELGRTYRQIAAAAGMEPVAVGRRLVAMERQKLITRRLKAEPKNKRDFEERGGMAIWWRA